MGHGGSGMDLRQNARPRRAAPEVCSATGETLPFPMARAM
jgi:hypothetical protein